MQLHPLRSRPLLAGAVVALLLAGTLAACTSTGDESSDGSGGSTTTTTLPDSIPSVAWIWANPEESTGADVRVPVYASIQGGTEADVLTGVKVDPKLAASAELVGAARVDLPATTTVNLAEDGPHIELVGLVEPLEYNRGFEITLEFATADDMKVQGVVRNPTDPNSTS